MNNEITVYQNFPSIDEIKNMQMIAQAAYKSGLYKNNPDAIVMTLLAARELNIGPCMAINGGIWVINGKVEISARLMSLLVRRAGHSLTINGDDKFCTIKGKRKDTGDVAEVTFTISDAEKAGLLVNQVWKKYPEDMLYARALSRLSRRLFSDVIGNAYVEGEIDTKKDVNPDPAKLPQAEAEVLSDEPKQESAIEENPLVTPTQAHELNRIWSMLSSEAREMIDTYRTKSLKVETMDILPEVHYEALMGAMKRRLASENNQPKE